jgi:SNF2 family DNA or RNA helicase|tara:strand:- start:420 stop:806 length:387 start_codon:yes stop_codon:yes gene_type:complete
LKAAHEGGLIIDDVVVSDTNALSFLSDELGVPRHIEATLYEYQVSGSRWLRFLITEGVGGLLADEMGLGKTLQVISAIGDPGDDILETVLVIAPGSPLKNWRREFAKFAPSLSVLKHYGRFRTGRYAD